VAEEFLQTFLAALIYQSIGAGLFLALELIFPRSRASFADRAGGFIFLLATAPVTGIVGALYAMLKPALGIPTLLTFHHSLWSPVFASVVLAAYVDLQFYVKHRIEHRFFWRFHAVHHSIRQLSAANSYHHWSEALMNLIVGIPLLFTDVSIGPTFGVLMFLFVYQQFYIHSSARPHFGPLRWLLVDNVYHRIHHSQDPAHHHRNFGAMTPLWDWLFGTLYMPRSNEWPEIGLKEIGQPDSLMDWHLLPWRLRNAPSLEREARPASGRHRLNRRPAGPVV
jgi:sterol desaturase/sphingolipid hydroxylase (fatty acid hydroxylase superfamily)